ncbi:MAG: hypothetical protein ACYTG5_23325 [Planctomycetota bacterium]|jgi:hypothetical protein
MAESNEQPIGYMERSRLYYEAQGFEKAYRWANFDEVPFTPLGKPLSESRLGIITTSATYARKSRDNRAVDTGPTAPPPERLYANDLSWDKKATHMDDRESYFPILQLEQAVEEGRLGSISPRFYCAPTSYSHRETLTEDGPEILKLCQEDGVDVALLVPL